MGPGRRLRRPGGERGGWHGWWGLGRGGGTVVAALVLVLLLAVVVVVLKGQEWALVLEKGVEIVLVLLPLPVVKMKKKMTTD